MDPEQHDTGQCEKSLRDREELAPVAPALSQSALGQSREVSYGDVFGHAPEFGVLSTAEILRDADFGDELASHYRRSEEVLNNDKYGAYLDAWRVSLAHSGTPLQFADKTIYFDDVIQIEENVYSIIWAKGMSLEERNVLIADTPVYTPKLQREAYPIRTHPDSKLGTNVLQAYDAKCGQAPCNVLGEFGDYILLPNKFPPNIGESLLLPWNADDMEQRIPLKWEGRNKILDRRVPEMDARTYGAIPSQEYIVTMMAVCDKYHLLSQRNHALDGMSEPYHDHFKVWPEDLPWRSPLDTIIVPVHSENDVVTSYRAHNTPFDTLVLTAGTRDQLSESIHNVLDTLERSGQIYTTIYYRGHFLITPRMVEQVIRDSNNANGKQYVSPETLLGSTVGGHGLSGEMIEKATDLIYHGGSFNWEGLLAAISDSHIQFLES